MNGGKRTFEENFPELRNNMNPERITTCTRQNEHTETHTRHISRNKKGQERILPPRTQRSEITSEGVTRRLPQTSQQQ